MCVCVFAIAFKIAFCCWFVYCFVFVIRCCVCDMFSCGFCTAFLPSLFLIFPPFCAFFSFFCQVVLLAVIVVVSGHVAVFVSKIKLCGFCVHKYTHTHLHTHTAFKLNKCQTNEKRSATKWKFNWKNAITHITCCLHNADARCRHCVKCCLNYLLITL